MPKLVNNKFDPSDVNYQSFLEAIKNQIISTRLRITKSVTQEQLSLYWWLGERIVEAQTNHGWGQSVVERLSNDLKQYFPTATYGFSARNLWDMRRIYLEYKEHPKLRQLVAEIPWGQNLLILMKIKNFSAREYYLKMVIQMGWTRDVLALQIASEAYERHVLTPKQHNFEKHCHST